MEMIQVPPGLTKLSKLISLDLSRNYKNLQVGRATFRNLLQNLTNLEVLLWLPMLTPLELPKNFSSSLRYLDLEGTLFGDISDSNLFRLPNLQVLALGRNFLLTGTLPNFNWSFSASILELDFFNTGIFGKVPDSIGNLHSLRYLNLQSYHLSGSIPESIGNLTAIRKLILSHNNFTGNVPSTIGKLNKLATYISLPITSKVRFQNPSGVWGNSSSPISILDLRMNNFHGEIPRSLPTGLQYLGLYGNQLGGQVPRSLVNCTSLEALDLGNNKINDTFPIWLEKLPYLQVMVLKSNLFHGPIGDFESEFSFPELRIFDLSFNGFTGTLPSNLFKSFRGMMDVDVNQEKERSCRLQFENAKLNILLRSSTLYVVAAEFHKLGRKRFRSSCRTSGFGEKYSDVVRLVEVYIVERVLLGRDESCFVKDHIMNIIDDDVLHLSFPSGTPGFDWLSRSLRGCLRSLETMSDGSHYNYVMSDFPYAFNVWTLEAFSVFHGYSQQKPRKFRRLLCWVL
ncbi:hypothetical protein RND71_042661 [Anisodus tanguticus]|uniref:Uncharacterized protein n=1 Tax=Anisodus tanguticus TaxID=243964 RepID=A0AAE1QQL9_9SOLA|nr:hypothetical protein RND71_042661 [Anisodus tanguticus]